MNRDKAIELINKYTKTTGDLTAEPQIILKGYDMTKRDEAYSAWNARQSTKPVDERVTYDPSTYIPKFEAFTLDCSDVIMGHIIAGSMITTDSEVLTISIAEASPGGGIYGRLLDGPNSEVDGFRIREINVVWDDIMAISVCKVDDTFTM